MFRASKLDKLVSAQIITEEQKIQILNFNDGFNISFIQKILISLGIFTIGVGIISIIAANWNNINDVLKLTVMFIALLGTSSVTYHITNKQQHKLGEKVALGIFFLIGASLGLVIQTFHLSGGHLYNLLGFWCLITASLLFYPKQNLISYFWSPLFIIWLCFYIAEMWDYDLDQKRISIISIFIGLSLLGKFQEKFLPQFSLGRVVSKTSFKIYCILQIFLIITASGNQANGLLELLIYAIFMGICSIIYLYIKDYKTIHSFLKISALLVIGLYINLGEILGLFHTGIGLIISGSIFIAILNYTPKIIRKIVKEKKDE